MPDEIIKLKKSIFVEMDKAFKKSGTSLKSLFNKIDVNQSDNIDLIEFKAMFERM